MAGSALGSTMAAVGGLQPQGGQKVGNQIIPNPVGGKGGTMGAAPSVGQPAQGGYAPLSPQGDFNVNQAAAGGLQQAMQGTQQAMGFQPQNVSAAQYAPATTGAQGYNAATTGSQGYNAVGPQSQGYGASTISGASPIAAQNVSGQGYDAARTGQVGPVSASRVGAGQIASTDLGAYTNQYETQVVDQSLADLERNRLMQQNQLGAQASAAGAFGGSRQGIAEAETNRAFADQAARTASGLRQAGFQNAQQLAGQDIASRMQASLANQQAGLAAGTTSAQLAQQANLANQSASNQANQFGASAANQAALANQQAGLTAQQSTAANTLAAQQANQAAQNQSSQFGASAANTAAQQLAAARNQAGQFGASAANQAALSNQAAFNQAGQFGASAANQAAALNQAAFNQAGQYNASNMMQAQQLNQQAQMQANQQRLGAASQMGQLGQQAFNTGQTIQQQQMQQGLMQQGLQQALIDAARGQYAGYTGSPAASLNAPLAALGVAGPNSGQTTTNTTNRGLFDYLGLGLGAMASDPRLKTNVTPRGEVGGIKLYDWDWNDEGKRIADPAQPTFGVMADELQATHPHLVERGDDGYLRVNYVGLIAEMEAA